jgi:hypothetical protein
MVSFVSEVSDLRICCKVLNVQNVERTFGKKMFKHVLTICSRSSCLTSIFYFLVLLCTEVLTSGWYFVD